VTQLASRHAQLLGHGPDEDLRADDALLNEHLAQEPTADALVLERAGQLLA